MEKQYAPLSQRASDVLEVLKKQGAMTMPELYKALPSYNAGDCDIDFGVAELYKLDLIFANGKRFSGDSSWGDSSWGTCIVWQAKESST